MVYVLATVWVFWASAANYHGPTPPGQFADKAACERAIQKTNLDTASLVCPRHERRDATATAAPPDTLSGF